MKTVEKVQRVTERGQITLPIAWRRKMRSKNIIVREVGDALEISPLRTEDERDEEWITIFDAVRDNKGKGVPAEQMITVLDKLVRRKTKNERAR